MYQLIRYLDSIAGVIRLADSTSIPFDPANQDYAQFKLDIANGVELQDANGQVMTAEQVQSFLATLPAEEN